LFGCSGRLDAAAVPKSRRNERAGEASRQRAPEEERWVIDFTPEAKAWLRGLRGRDTQKVGIALDRLERDGPYLRRPHAGIIKGSRYRNMKELRSVGGHLRALFVFDPRRHAIVLLGGDKTNDWDGWYARNIPEADKLYDRHLRSLGKGRPWTTMRHDSRAGARSDHRSR
jgi:hypothetical protein